MLKPQKRLCDKIWVDGELIDWDDANVHMSSHVLHYGSSVFEGIRAYNVGGTTKVFHLDAHVDRLYDSAKIYRMEIPYTKDQFKDAIMNCIKVNKFEACYIRPIVFRNVGAMGVNPFPASICCAILTWIWGAYLGKEAVEEGVDICVATWSRMHANTHAGIAKAGGNYLNSQLMKMEAITNGYVEAIALQTNGYIAEGSGENLFMVGKRWGTKHPTIFTPPLSASILSGITRASVIQLASDIGMEVVEQTLPREALYVCDELFFTGTAAEITPIKSVDRIPVGPGKRGPITKRLQEELFGILKGEKPDVHHWLTPVN
ncbi:MAG: branched-chain amino acid transaminase [Planctomycetes bacterium]|nr:branched-chain amino acid transaminase [Planctomycetota bacterium]